MKYSVKTFCSSITGNYCWAYPSETKEGLTLKQLKESPYNIVIVKDKEAAQIAYEKLRDATLRF